MATTTSARAGSSKGASKSKATTKRKASPTGKATARGSAAKKKTKKQPLARTADKYDLYQQSVQDPAFEVKVLKRFYKDVNGTAPRTLREDFCGAFAVCCEWARSGKDTEAWGVDYDPEPLAWGAEHNLSSLKPAQQARVHVVEGDVRTAKTPKVDIVTAQNFSYYIFRERAEMRRYFQQARKHLNENGIFVLDMLGGPQVQEDDEEERRKVNGFTYVWEQVRFNPIDHGALFHIHFHFKDGSKLDKAFSYEWRLWTMPEIREILLEAGFSKTHVYWEAEDKNGEGNGRFYRTEKAPADLTWLAYVVAER
jgi:SAM-dependent methyltransferase